MIPRSKNVLTMLSAMLKHDDFAFFVGCRNASVDEVGGRLAKYLAGDLDDSEIDGDVLNAAFNVLIMHNNYPSGALVVLAFVLVADVAIRDPDRNPSVALTNSLMVHAVRRAIDCGQEIVNAFDQWLLDALNHFGTQSQFENGDTKIFFCLSRVFLHAWSAEKRMSEAIEIFRTQKSVGDLRCGHPSESFIRSVFDLDDYLVGKDDWQNEWGHISSRLIDRIKLINQIVCP